VLSLASYNLQHKQHGLLEVVIKTYQLSGVWYEMFGLQQMVELLILYVQEGCLLQQIIEGKIKGGTEVMGRCRKLLDDLKERRGYIWRRKL
jgi:hypothetical protein